MKKVRQMYRASNAYIIIFILFEMTIAFSGLRNYENYEKNFNANVENQLGIIVNLKIREIEHWLNELQSDAAFLYDNEVLSDIVKRYFKNPDDLKTKRQIYAWLRNFHAGSNYNAVILTDPELIKEIVISDATERPQAFISPGNIDSLRKNKLVFEDFYTDESQQKIFLKILIPVLDVRQLIGIIELRIDPKTYLYPTLEDWPMPSETSESMILRREGNEAVYLSELKFQKNAALNLRLPIEQKNLPAVRAVLDQAGFVNGIGYRGNAVVAHVGKIPNSPWYLVAQTDESEVYAPLKEKRLEMGLVYLSMILLAAVAMVVVWRRQLAQVFRERIKSAEALRESEERFRTLFDKAPLSYESLDAHGNFIDINDTWLETFGYKREEVIGKWFGDFLVPEEVEEFKERFPIFKETGKRQSEFKLIHKNGTIIDVFFVGRIARDSDGNFLQTHGILQNVTLFKKSELEREVTYEITKGVTTTDKLADLLKLIHQSLGKVFYAKNIFVALHDENTGLFSFPYWVDEFDPIPEPVSMRKSLSSYIFHTAKSILFSQELFQQLKEQNEVELVGSLSPSWIGVPLQTPTETIGVLVLQHYEKENVYSERDIQFLYSVGSQIATAIERKMAEEEIKHKNEELSKINSEKDKFFSIIAHDLRGPFSGFLGLTQIMAEESSSLSTEELQEMAVNMEKSASTLFRLLENLLQWARMQQGSIPFNPIGVQLLSFVHESIAIVMDQANFKRIDITVDISADLSIFADDNMLQTIIRNLVSNALKFTHKGGKVTISASTGDDNNVVVAIKDTGIGMSSEMVDNLFRLDVQTGRPGTNGESSSGLGLLLCKEFIEKHGGKIWVESEVGHGSTFYFTLATNNS
jgi:PAS domain S-box-containing protein